MMTYMVPSSHPWKMYFHGQTNLWLWSLRFLTLQTSVPYVWCSLRAWWMDVFIYSGCWLAHTHNHTWHHTMESHINILPRCPVCILRIDDCLAQMANQRKNWLVISKFARTSTVTKNWYKMPWHCAWSIIHVVCTNSNRCTCWKRLYTVKVHYIHV